MDRRSNQTFFFKMPAACKIMKLTNFLLRFTQYCSQNKKKTRITYDCVAIIGCFCLVSQHSQQQGFSSGLVYIMISSFFFSFIADRNRNSDNRLSLQWALVLS